MKNISLTTISNLLTILTGLLVAYNTYLVGKFNTELAEKESERELNFRIYESVIEALESENEKRILAIKVIVKSMANEKLKPGFLDVLETGEVKVFENEEVQKNPKVTPPKDNGKSKWKTWNFDLFWCENSGFTGERLAKEIEHLFKQNGFSGQIRVRYLAESVTRRKNFGKPADFEIRVDAGEELSSAEKILELIGKSSSIKKEEFNIFKVSEKSKIPGYVSLFFCP